MVHGLIAHSLLYGLVMCALIMLGFIRPSDDARCRRVTGNTCHNASGICYHSLAVLTRDVMLCPLKMGFDDGTPSA